MTRRYVWRDRWLTASSAVLSAVPEVPVILVRRKTLSQRQRNAFELGVDAGSSGLVKPRTRGADTA